MSDATIPVRFTPAQLNMVNAALAMYEAEEHDPEAEPGFRVDVLERTRTIVHNALDRYGVRR